MACFNSNAPIVQRIGHKIADLKIEVRFLVGAQIKTFHTPAALKIFRFKKICGF